MEIKKKIFDVQNHYINVVIHNTLNAKWMELTIVCACTFFFLWQIPFDRFTTVFGFNFSRKTILLLSLMLKAIDNKIYQNTGKAYSNP